MRTLIRNNKAVATVAGGALVVMTAGAAYAFWATTGNGNGSASSAATAATLALAGPTTQVTGLVPGGSIDVPITASNSSPTTSLAATTLTASALTVDSAHAACLTLVAKPVLTDTDPSAQVVVAPGSSADFGKVTISLANSATEDQGACKGAVFGFTLAAG